MKRIAGGHGVQIGIGPPIENGYYYDFNAARPFTPEDLAAIEAEMRKIITEDFSIVREEMPVEKIKRIATNKMDERHRGLNALMDD